MPTTAIGFSQIEQLNKMQRGLYTSSHHDNHNIFKKTGFWLGHKAVSVITIPANAAVSVASATGAALSGCILGAIKVAIFAGSLGSWKPTFSTGVPWFCNRIINSGNNLCATVVEIVWDGISLPWNILSFTFERLKKGLDKAEETELGYEASFETPAFIRPLNNIAKENRINFDMEERSFKEIAVHTAISFINIPVNAIAAIVSGIATIILLTAFEGKVLLYAATNININVPTFFRPAFGVACSTTGNVCLDTGTTVADIFVSIYKISKAIRIAPVLTTALRVVCYIPEAIFS